MKILEVKGLCKRYASFELRDVSFDVTAGSIVGFVGRNGAGKSTTIKSILGVVHPDSGMIRFCGRDISSGDTESAKHFKENIGVAMGGVDFYPKKKLRAISEVTSKFYHNWNWEKYAHYCELFSLDQNKRIDELSSGMKVKYLIALALSHEAKLLILDEPTSGLDPVSRDELVELFRAIVKDGSRSILFSTHITSDLEKCADHIAFIKDGSIVHAGDIDGFMSTFADKGESLEDIIVAMERRAIDDGSII